MRNKRIEDVLFHARDTSIFLGNKKNSQLHEMGKMFFEEVKSHVNTEIQAGSEGASKGS